MCLLENAKHEMCSEIETLFIAILAEITKLTMTSQFHVCRKLYTCKSNEEVGTHEPCHAINKQTVK